MSVQSIWIATELSRRLGNHAHDTKAGWVLSEQTIDCFPWRERYMRRPDVCYVAKERLAILPAEGPLTLAPDVCIEVVSPNDNAYDLSGKTEDYFRAGVALVLHVFPEERTVHVYRPDGTAAVLRDGQAFVAADVLPGLAIAVTDVFPPKLA